MAGNSILSYCNVLFNSIYARVISPDRKTPSVPLTLILKFVLLVSSKLICELFGGVEVSPNPTVLIPVINIYSQS